DWGGGNRVFARWTADDRAGGWRQWPLRQAQPGYPFRFGQRACPSAAPRGDTLARRRRSTRKHRATHARLAHRPALWGRLPGRLAKRGSPKLMNANQTWTQSNRLAGLRRFAIAITLLNILGHTVFGFEQSWAQPLVSLAAAYTMEIILELAGGKNRRPRTWLSKDTIDFLLPAHITGLAVAM